MDILTPAEISSINNSSVMVQKYSQLIDRESAYEILGRKVSEVNQEKAQEQQRKDREIEQKREEQNYPPRTSYGSRTKSPQDQMVKVLTSATFIRGVFGILSKVLR
jgi:hypothetical protein